MHPLESLCPLFFLSVCATHFSEQSAGSNPLLILHLPLSPSFLLLSSLPPSPHYHLKEQGTDLLLHFLHLCSSLFLINSIVSFNIMCQEKVCSHICTLINFDVSALVPHKGKNTDCKRILENVRDPTVAAGEQISFYEIHKVQFLYSSQHGCELPWTHPWTHAYLNISLLS